MNYNKERKDKGMIIKIDMVHVNLGLRVALCTLNLASTILGLHPKLMGGQLIFSKVEKD